VENDLEDCSTDLAASECADALGVSRVIARKHLEHFVRMGKAVVTLRYGQTGRPQRRYSWISTYRP
jgi:response regulator of citrate/malate metabolism